MNLLKCLGLLVISMLLCVPCSLLAQTASNIENGFKAFGSYQGGKFDTVNLQTGNVMFHVPLFSYPQRGGKLGVNYVLSGSSKNWQVEEWTDSQHNIHQKWVLAQPAGIGIVDPTLFEVHRSRHLTTDFAGNQTYTVDNYAIATQDGTWHWLSGSTPSGHMMTKDGSGIQLVLTQGIKQDLSDDTATVIFRDGTRYPFSNISVPMPVSGQGNNVTGVVIQPELVLDAWGTTQTAYDNAQMDTRIDANGNAMGSSTDTLGHGSGGVVTTSDYSGCVTPGTITSAYLFNVPGPDGRSSGTKVCMTGFVPTAAFSQPNVDPPRGALVVGEVSSFPNGGGSYIGSIVMPDGNHWSFGYDTFGNMTGITLPAGGTISYQWIEISSTCADGGMTRVSRAVSSRTVNDLSTSQTWHYTWGALQQDGSITNYVLDPNGNETAHVFRPVTSLPCSFYEVQTRSYQGSHINGTLMETTDTHYVADFGYTASSQFAADVVADSVTTTLLGNKVAKVVRQYDSGGSNMPTFGKVIDEKVYDFGSGAPGPLLRETATTYQWQSNSAYLDAGFMDLPASVVVKDGAGCTLAETDYAYDEPSYLAAYTGTLPAGTHVSAPSGTIRGNLTTATKWLAATGSCNPKGGAAVSSHTKWYDTGVPYQSIDPLGHTTTLAYDSAYAGAYVTQTCSPQTSGVAHCVSGTYDFVTGLLESFTNENATTPASGNIPGDSQHTATYAYDTSWRLTSAQAPPDPANNNAQATTTLTPSAANAFPLTVQASKSVTAAMNDLLTTTFDGLARPFKTQHAVPGNIATVLTTYDGVGQAASVTNPFFTTADPTYGVTSSQYDGLGRVMQTTRQDGSISKVQYSVQPAQAINADCTKVTDEAGTQRVACADAVGRLIEVDEPNPAAPAVAAQGTLTINGTLQSHTSSGSPAVKAGATVSIWSSDPSGADAHFDDLSEPCPPLPQTCPQIYDSGWIAVTVNGLGVQVSYGQFDTNTSLAAALTNAINGSGLSAYVTASVVNGMSISLQAKNAGAAGNSITVSGSSGTNDPGDFGGPSFGGNRSSATLVGGADAINPVTTWDQGTVTLTVGSFTASAPYGQSTNSTTSQVASALASSGPTGLNRAGSPVSATANGSGITITYATGGTVGNGVVVSSGSQSTQTQWTFSPASFSSTGTPLANGLNAGDASISPFITLYAYDALGNLLRVDQKGTAPTDSTQWRTRTFTYDSLSRLLTASNPESGTLTYIYDNDGNLLQKTSPAANQTGTATQTVSYCYDALHRVTGKGYGVQTCPLASPVVSYVYDSGANAKGKLVSMTDQAGTATYGYDILGRMSTETRTLMGSNPTAISQSVSYDYNLDGSLKTLHYPSGAAVTYTPDSAGRMLSAVDSGHSINYVTGATYGPDSSLAGFVSGNSGIFAGITNAFSYNKRLQPVTMSATASSQTVFSIGYDFHLGNGTTGSDNGNVWGIYNYRDRTRDQAFTYDALNRLTSAQNAGTDCTVNVLGGNKKFWGNTYGYDAWGNLTNKTKISTACAGENLGINVDVTNRLLSGYLYDAAGNMTHDATSGLNYHFDQENRITGANGYTYTYDGDGNRVSKSNGTAAGNGTLYWYMTPGVVAETDLAGTLKSEYVFFDGERVARRDGVNGAGGVFYYFSDHLKTASVITDSAGVIKAESDYYPWGGELQFVNNDSNDYKFTGKERDAETGLDDFGARYYGSALGRFITPDPLLNSGRPNDPQSWNRYSYVRNNPLNRIDPTGLYDLNNTCGANDSKCNKQFNQHAKDLKNGLSNLQKQLKNVKDPVQKARLEKALGAIGTEGDHNGVNVGFGATKGGGAGETDPVYNQQTGKETYNVTFDPSKLSSENDYAVAGAHEGTHVDDINTMLANPAGGALSDFSLEYRGYQTSAFAASALGSSSLSMNYDGKSYPIWNGSWGAVDKNITNFVTKFHDKNGQPDHPQTTPHNPWPN